jgi:four helix bundle protein
MEGKSYDLQVRLFAFAVDILKFLSKLPYSPENKVLRTQLAKSSTSSGANYEEAQGGCTKLEFSNRIKISTREMRESNYWLRLIKYTVKEIYVNELDKLINESSELKKILGAIGNKLK